MSAAAAAALAFCLILSCAHAQSGILTSADAVSGLNQALSNGKLDGLGAAISKFVGQLPDNSLETLLANSPYFVSNARDIRYQPRGAPYRSATLGDVVTLASDTAIVTLCIDQQSGRLVPDYSSARWKKTVGDFAIHPKRREK